MGILLLQLLIVGFYTKIRQRLRLRGIDTPEMDTDEGVRAKRFVETRLNKGSVVVVNPTSPKIKK